MPVQKTKLQLPTLQKALRLAPEEFRMLKAAYTGAELKQFEQKLSNDSWHAGFLPSVVAEAKRRLDRLN